MVIARPWSELNREACVAFITVKEVLSSSNSADATLITMELTFTCIVIKQIALQACILPKEKTAVGTTLSWFLLKLAILAPDLLHLKPVHLMVGNLVIEQLASTGPIGIMTETTVEV